MAFKKPIDKRLRTFVNINQVVFLVCVFLTVFGAVSFGYHGFGVDSAGRVYVGLGHKIDVYEDGEKVHTIRKGTDRGYCFTVRPDDTILLASGEDVFVFDLMGVEEYEWYEDPSVGEKLEKYRYEQQTDNGDRYEVRRPLGRITIFQNDLMVYRMSLFDYLVMLLLFLSTPGFVVGVFMSRKWMKDNDWLPG